MHHGLLVAHEPYARHSQGQPLAHRLRSGSLPTHVAVFDVVRPIEERQLPFRCHSGRNCPTVEPIQPHCLWFEGTHCRSQSGPPAARWNA